MKNLLIIALLVFVGISTNAQGLSRKAPATTKQTTEKLTPTERADRLTKRMQTQLELDKKQHKAVSKINLQAATEIEQIKNSRMSVEMQREKIRVVNENRDNNFKNVLNAQQFERYIIAKDNRASKKTNATKVDRLNKQLNLSPEQTAEIKAINREHKKAVKALTSAGTVTKSELRTIKDSKRAQVKKVLTPEQARRYDALQTKKQEMRENPAARAERMTNHMAEKLNLTPAQKSQVAQVNQKAANAKQRLKAGNEINVEATKRALKSIELERTQSLSKILTPAQMEQYKAIKAERKVVNQKRQTVKQMPRPH